MNLRLLLAGLLLSGSVVGCQSVDTSTFDLEAAGATGYVFRGLRMNEGPGAEVQATVDLNRGDTSTLSGYVWGYVDVTGDPSDGALETNNDLRFSRLDVGAYWSRTYTDWAFSAGVLNYNFPNVVAASTTEVFFSAERVDKWYRPRGVFYYDLQNADDFYIRVGSHPRYEFDRALYGDIGFDLGYMGDGQGRFYYGAAESGISDALLTAGLTYVQDETFRAFLRFGFAAVLESGLKDQNDLNGFENDSAWFSVGCGWTY